MGVKVVSAVFALLAAWSSQCIAAEEASPPVPESAKQPAVAAPAQKPAAKPSASAAQEAKTTPGKAKATSVKKPVWRTEAELSGMTSEISDVLQGRLNLNRSFGPRKWWLRTGYAVNKSRTYTNKNKVNETDIRTFNLDTQYRLESKNNYRFISGVANVRNRTTGRQDKTGYHMLSAGYGKTILPGLEAELAMADITRFEKKPDHRVAPVYSLRLKTGLTDSMTLDSDTHFVQPWTEDSLVDSRVNLTYKLTSALSMRLTYVANNMFSPLFSKTGWDKSYRVSLVFSRGSN